MSRIRDKKRWFAVMCCKSQTAVTPNGGMLGLGLGLGLLGAMVVTLAFGILLSAAAVHVPLSMHYGLGVGLISDQLKQVRTAKAEQAQGIYSTALEAKRAITTEEKTLFDSLMVDVEGLGPQIDAQVKIEAVLRDKPAQVIAPVAIATVDAGPRIEFSRQYTLKAFTPGAFNTRAEAEKAAYRSGKWLQALMTKSASALAYCQEHGIFSWGTREVIHNLQEEGVNSTGGALVPAEFENAIIDLREQFGVFRRLAKIVPMATDTKIQPRRVGGLTAYPLAESGAFTESTKNWDNVQLNAKLWGVLAKFSTAFGEDAVINVADDLASEAAYAFATAEDDAGLNGTGSGAYGGIIGVLTKFGAFVDSAGSGAVNPATATHDLFTEFDGKDIDQVVAALPQYADPNARFIAARVFKSLVFDPLLRAGGGNNKSDIAGRMLNTYLGYPIEISQKMPNSATTSYQNLPVLLFGDFAAAVSMGVRRGITVQILNELFAQNGQIGVICSERFDINCHDIGNATSPGPLVALIGSSS